MEKLLSYVVFFVLLAFAGSAAVVLEMPLVSAFPTIDFFDPTDPNFAEISRNHTYVNFSVTNNSAVSEAVLEWDGLNVTVWGDSLRALWHFNTGVTDSSGNGFTWTNTGATCGASVRGVFGGACNFTNPSDLTIASGNAFQFSGKDFTVEAWVNWPGAFPNLAGPILSKWGAGNNRGFLLTSAVTGHPAGTYSFYYHSTNGSFNNSEILHSTPGWNDGDWHHVAAVFSRGVSAQIYIDGVLNNQSVVPVSKSVANTSAPLTVALRDGNYFDGGIDELRVWDKNLSADEVELLYRSEIGQYYANITLIDPGFYQYRGHVLQAVGSNVTDVRNLGVNVGFPAPTVNVSILDPEEGETFAGTDLSLNSSIVYVTNNSGGFGLTYYLYFDNVFNHTAAGNSSFNLTNGGHTVAVSAFNGSVWSQNATVTFTIDLNLVPSATWVRPNDNDFFFDSNVINFNYTGLDPDGDNLTFYVFENGSLQSISDKNFSSRLENGVYFYEVSAFDGQFFSVNDSVTFTVDIEEEVSGEWPLAVALLYVASLGFMLFVGFTIRDKVVREVATVNGILKKEINDGLLSVLKTLIFMSVPAFVLLGVRIAALTAASSGAPDTVVGALWTAFNWFTWLYVFIAMVFLIVLFRNVLAFLQGLLQSSANAGGMKQRRLARRGEQR